MEIYLLSAVCAVLAIIIALVFIKDGETNRKFARFERTIEGLMQENFSLKKQLSALSSDKQDNAANDTDALKEELKTKLEADLNEKITPIVKAIKNIERIIDEFASEHKNRIDALEERTRAIGKITPNADGENDQIIRMFNSGKSVEQIAKDMRLGVGKVELALKMRNLV
ncbi:MAG: DUF6115 domain-containing protein [Campylobacter sp.]|jgi:hypothetical protein